VLDQLGELVAELDVQSPQVLVEAMIVSLTEAQTSDLGVELQKGFRRDELFFRLQSLFELGSPDPSASSLAQVPGTGFTSVVLDPGSFSGVLRALATVNDGRSLTIPKVLVNNNEQANLNSILQTPYTSTSLSTSTSITSFGGTLDAGTTIAVKPQITDGDMMLLEYSVSLSSFVGESADASVPPPRQETSLSSVASVPDGYAVIIGGLEIESEGDSISKLPFLGDIPLLGALFQNKSTSNSRSRFFVFLRCSVMRNSMFEDLKYVSRRDLEVAGVETGAPEVRPLIMR
jgi:type II secretory pathway component GspD/PulD (secretin)